MEMMGSMITITEFPDGMWHYDPVSGSFMMGPFVTHSYFFNHPFAIPLMSPLFNPLNPFGDGIGFPVPIVVPMGPPPPGFGPQPPPGFGGPAPEVGQQPPASVPEQPPPADDDQIAPHADGHISSPESGLSNITGSSADDYGQPFLEGIGRYSTSYSRSPKSCIGSAAALVGRRNLTDILDDVVETYMTSQLYYGIGVACLIVLYDTYDTTW
ncbi:uncharacterized protein DS421_10g314810 [Arachis hypogaea]|nr:uncharacterized protein DS421_10g314810 [Arachis hypogaea]